MIKGLYAAATGMMAIESRQAIVANNVANASTPGFRRQEGLVKGFYDIYLDKMGTVAQYNNRIGPGGGVSFEETYTETRGGAVTATGDPLNVALDGPGFLSVTTPIGDRFTRNGKFTVDVDGELATAEGLKIQGQGGGAIDVSGGGLIAFNANGTVSVGGENRGQLNIVEFADPHSLERQGENLYYANDAAMGQSTQGVNTKINGQSLEMSNVQVPIEMVSMMMGMRAYNANQKVISTISQTMDRVINQVGSPS